MRPPRPCRPPTLQQMTTMTTMTTSQRVLLPLPPHGQSWAMKAAPQPGG
jgi:hypothetical protein